MDNNQQRINPNTLPKLTSNHKATILLIYRFRFLDRYQIQRLLGKKHFKNVITWLNFLTKHHFLHSFPSEQAIPPRPTRYCLDRAAIHFLRTHLKDDIEESVLHQIYKEKDRLEVFRNKCMFLADVYLSLCELAKNNYAKLSFWTQRDLHGMEYLLEPAPFAFFSLSQKNKTTARYFLELITANSSYEDLLKRVGQYFAYYKKRLWQNNNKHEFPEIIFLCSDMRSKNYLNKIIQYNLGKNNALTFSLGIWQDVKIQGISKNILQKVVAGQPMVSKYNKHYET